MTEPLERKVTVVTTGDDPASVRFEYRAYLGDELVGLGSGYYTYDDAEKQGQAAIQQHIDEQMKNEPGAIHLSWEEL